MIVCNFVGCNVYIKWFEHCAEILDVPLVMIDIPFVRKATRPVRSDIHYVVAQLKELIATCEKADRQEVRHRPAPRDLSRYSARAEAGWSRAKDLCKNSSRALRRLLRLHQHDGPDQRPPRHAGCGRVLRRGRADYETMVDRRARRHPDEEKFRIVVEGPPPYPYYRNFRNLFDAVEARRRPEHLLHRRRHLGVRLPPRSRSAARVHRRADADAQPLQPLDARALQPDPRYVEDWKADALVIHSVKSCRLFSGGQGDMREYFTKELGVPTLMVESDLEDPRYYAEAQMKNRIDAFFESLEHYKRVRETARQTTA